METKEEISRFSGHTGDLLPCPFCGSDGIMVKIETTGQYYPKCSGGSGKGFCLLTRILSPENDGFVHRKHAIDQWNKRLKT